MKRANVISFGAVGNGTADDSSAIQAAFDSGADHIRIPSGKYRITRTLRVPSGVTVSAADDARIFSCGETPKKRGDFLLTNADHENGNENITIKGGIWDGNNQGRLNKKPDDLFDPRAWSGSVLDFCGVRNLRLEKMTVANSVTYNIRMCRIDGFVFRHISFASDKIAYNQDGLHFGGECRNGRVFDVKAVSKGQTNDDLLALNADDSLVRLENRDLVCGPIENITFRLVRAEDCHTAIRLLSTVSPIRNIRICDINTGVRLYAVNADAARYCRTPLFKDEDYPDGVGCLENIRICNFRFHGTRADGPEPICIESNADKLLIRNFTRDLSKDARPDVPDVRTLHLKSGTRIRKSKNSLSVIQRGA